MREFVLLPAVAVAGAFCAIIALALCVLIVAPVLIGIGILFWIGERQGWARMGGLHRNGEHRDDA